MRVFFVQIKTKVVRKLLCSVVPRLCFVKCLGEMHSMWLCYHLFKKKRTWMYKDVMPNDEDECPSNVVINKSIFVFWRQGFDSAPEIVKKCVESVKKHLGGYSLVLLDETNLRDYVKLPEHIWKLKQKNLIGEPQFSDLVRTNLLIRYGGVWCDATCFWNDEIPLNIERSPFFVFKTVLLKENCSPIKCSNWFIKAEKNNPILRKVQNFLFEYYRHYSRPIHYFIYHIALSVIVDSDQECSELWKDIPYICNMNPHVFMYSFASKYEETTYRDILKTSFVHKLTYKTSDSVRFDSSNILNHFLMS